MILGESEETESPSVGKLRLSLPAEGILLYLDSCCYGNGKRDELMRNWKPEVLCIKG